MATWTDVAEIVSGFPETVEGTSYGLRAWKIGKKLLAWARPLRKADLAALGPEAPAGEILALPTRDVFERDELVAAAPEVFFTTPHFDGHAVVLASLDALPVDVLEQLVRDAWLRSAPRRLVDQTSM